MRILLVSFQTNTETLGLRLLHHLLLDRGHSSTLLFFPRGLEQRDFVDCFDWVSKWNPDAVGVSLMTEEFRYARRFTDEWKRRQPRPSPVIWGGVHPTVRPEECLESAYYVCIGEGEDALLDWLEALRKGNPDADIPNIARKGGAGQIVQPGLRPLDHDLDQWHPLTHDIPNAHVLHKGRVRPLDAALFRRYSRYRGRVYSALATRGCPLHCSFCVNSAMMKVYGGKALKIRKRRVSAVLAELRIAVEAHPEILYVNFQDDCFLTLSEEWLEEFSERYPREVGRPFIIRPIPTFVAERKLRLIRDAGLAWVFMGLQSGDEAMNRELYQRPQSNVKFLEAARVIDALGLGAAYDVIVDNPLEPEESTALTVDLLSRLPRPYQLNIYSLTTYPGAPLAATLEAHGLVPPLQAYTKNYAAYRPSYYNRLLRMAPVLPSVWIRFLNRPAETRRALHGWGLHLSRPVAFLLEPLSFLWLFFRASRWKPGAVAHTLTHFLMEGFYRIYLRRPAFSRADAQPPTSSIGP